MIDKPPVLSDEEISEVIQRDTTFWCPTKGEFLHEVGRVVANAQHKKTLEGIVKWLEKHHTDTDRMEATTYEVFQVPQDEWQSLQKEVEK